MRGAENRMQNWYETSYRRNLVDMHIEDWDDSFLSRFSPEDYFENLRRAETRSAMLYLQSHVGYCYYPTRVGKMHRAFERRPDAMRRLVELCHAGGMDVIGYYSLIFNTWAEREHPEWRILETDTQSRYEQGRRFGLCCPNNREYVAFVKAQIREIADYFPPLEGMFYDMTYWPVLCRCPACRARWREESGQELPTEPDWNDAAWNRYYRSRCRWIGAFAAEITDFTRAVMPGVSVEHNYANSVAAGWEACSTEAVNAACDYTGGDLHGDLRTHSFSAKYFYAVTGHRPFEHMVSRFDGDLCNHTVSKGQNRMDVEILLNAAHHGASFIIDAMDPVGTLDSRVYEKIGRSMRKEMVYEPYFRGELIADVGILFSTTGKYNPLGERYDSRTCSIAASDVLSAEHIPYAVCPRGMTDRALAGFACVTAGGIAGLDEPDREAIERYVCAGGSFFFSGVGDPALLRRLLGADAGEILPHRVTYLAPVSGSPLEGEFNMDYPIPMPYRQTTVRAAADCDVLAYLTLPYTVPGERRFASIHSNPPGVRTEYPAVLSRRLGRGRVIWSALPLEMSEHETVRACFTALIRLLLPKSRQTISAGGAPRTVELVSFRDAEGISISTVELGVTEERCVIPEFDISVLCPQPVRAVYRIADGIRVPFSQQDGRLCFRTPPAELFAMYRIEYGGKET